MGVAMFMKVDGVTGESADAQHKGWTDIQSFTWGASQPGAMASGSGGNAGKASFNDLVVAAYMDRARPRSSRTARTASTFRRSRSPRKTGGTQVEFMRVTLQEVLVTSAQVAGIDPGDVADRLMMHYGFQAAKVKKQYWQQNDNGGKGAEVTVGWNIKENTEM